RLGFEDLAFVIGGSLGGMQALQWALAAPQRVRHAIIVGAHDGLHAMSLALCALQREALLLDPAGGLRLARKIAMLTYKSAPLLDARHGRRADRRQSDRFDVEGYLDVQADRLAARMDARSYDVLTQAMMTFDVRDVHTNGFTGRRPALTFVGIGSDWLFPADEVREAAERFAARGFDARYLYLESQHGHDAFLADAAALRALLEPVIAECGVC
ncbi:MAG: alpha/beta fold hydrolase, partial [Candidatus Tumulicola sp.]